MSSLRSHSELRRAGHGLLVGSALLLASCTMPSPMPGGETGMEILEVSAPRYHGSPGHSLEAACLGWKWSPDRVAEFFQLSEGYREVPYARFYQVGCGVSGRLRADGQEWSFAINGGGMATWTNGSTIRHFGCSAAKCADFLLLESDAMAPD